MQNSWLHSGASPALHLMGQSWKAPRRRVPGEHPCLPAEPYPACAWVQARGGLLASPLQPLPSPGWQEHAGWVFLGGWETGTRVLGCSPKGLMEHYGGQLGNLWTAAKGTCQWPVSRLPGQIGPEVATCGYGPGVLDRAPAAPCTGALDEPCIPNSGWAAPLPHERECWGCWHAEAHGGGD